MRRADQKIAILLILLVFFGATFSAGAFYAKKLKNNASDVAKNLTVSNPVVPKVPEPEPFPVDEATKAKVAEAPPKHESTKITTTTESNGESTTIISEGALPSAEAERVASAKPSGTSPYDVHFTDETGRYPKLEQVLKDYLYKNLRWGNEISSLIEIYVRDAGDTGWSGQYAGSYRSNAAGDIVSANGAIVLNTSYYKDKSEEEFNTNMRLIISHEYGHHYTLYHKWVDLDLPMNARFPDSYYIDRPLSKSDTTTDCSTDWERCESEIVAEDYSYLYSGYNIHQMSNIFGLPSDKIRSWMDGLVNATTAPETIANPSPVEQNTTPDPVPVPVDNPPEITISSPAENAEVSGIINFQVTASDDSGSVAVGFYIDGGGLGGSETSPFQVQIDTKKYPNGPHTLKAVAYDADNSTEKSISVTFNNVVVDTEKPVVIFDEPVNPYSWTQGNLPIRISSTDNVGVIKVKVYINDQLQGEVAASGVKINWPYNSAPAGTYVLKAEALDEVGNTGEATLTINKS